MSDKYDEDMQELLESAYFPSAAVRHWDCFSALFQTCSPSGNLTEFEDGSFYTCGCLTQIRDDDRYVAVKRDHNGNLVVDQELTEQIRQDERIPKDKWDITPDSLEVFAEWQRKLDSTIRNQ